jgi:hypothetical protein
MFSFFHSKLAGAEQGLKPCRMTAEGAKHTDNWGAGKCGIRDTFEIRGAG